MSMRRLCLSCVLLVGLALPASATDTTYELLSAPHVHGTLTLQLNSDKKLLYLRDSDPNYRTLQDNTAFVIDDQIDLVFHGFNPFLVTISSTEKTEADPNFGSLAKFLDAAQKLGLFQTESGTAGMSASSALAGLEERSEKGTELTKLLTIGQSLKAAINDTDCTAYNKLHEGLSDLRNNLGTIVVSKQTFDTWTESSNNPSGVKEVRDDILKRVETFAQLEKAMKEILSAIDQLAAKGASPNEPRCDRFRASTLALAVDVSHKISEVMALRREISSKLQDLRKYLASFEDKTAWRTDGDYIFLRPTSDFNNVKLLTVNVRKRTMNGGDNDFEIVEEDPVSTTFRLRQHSLLVPEVGVAVVATDLDFPKYGTEEKDGKILVKDAGDDEDPIKAAMMLNLTWRAHRTLPVFPGLQIGLTQTESYPGLLAGINFRFVYPRPFSLSVGRLFAWYKDLETLKPGDPITGTADIEKDLERHMKQATYFAIQYTF
jgi:hypothetical protein